MHLIHGLHAKGTRCPMPFPEPDLVDNPLDPSNPFDTGNWYKDCMSEV
jgi:hypothetical protein